MGNRGGNYRAKVEMYILSLWLLFLLIIIITADIPIYFGDDWRFIGLDSLFLINIIPIVALSFLTIGVIFYFRFGYMVKGRGELPVRVVEISDHNYEHLTFLTTYIIPLICFNLFDTRYLIVLAILLIIIGVIYVKTDKFYANPTLAVLGYKLYKGTLQTSIGKREVILISKDIIKESDLLNIKYLDNKVAFARRKNND